MAIEVECGSCGKSYRLPDDKAGRKFRCRECEAVISVPAAGAGSPWRAVADSNDDDELPAPPRTGRSAGAKAPKPGTKSKSVSKPKTAGGSKNGSRAPLVVGLVAGVVLLVGGGIGAYFLMRGGNGTPKDGVAAGGGEAVASTSTADGEARAGSGKSASSAADPVVPGRPDDDTSSAKKSFAGLRRAAEARDWPRLFSHYSPGSRQFFGTSLVHMIVVGTKAMPEKEAGLAADLKAAGIDLEKLKSLPLPDLGDTLGADVFRFDLPVLTALFHAVAKLDPTMTDPLGPSLLAMAEITWPEDGPDRAVAVIGSEFGDKSTGRFRDERPLVFVPIEGRWVVDLEASLKIDLRGLGKPPAAEVRTVAIDQSEPRKAYESYLSAIRSRDWKHRLQCVDPDMRSVHVRPLLSFLDAQNIFSDEPFQPEFDKPLRAVFERHGLMQEDVKALAFPENDESLRKVFGKIADPPTFYAEIHAVYLKKDPRHDLEIVEQVANDVVLGIDVQGDVATVVVRAATADPRSVGATQFQRMKRIGGRWFYERNTGEGTELSREFMRRYVEPDARLVRTLSAPDSHSLRAILALPGGSLVATAGANEMLAYWDVQTGERKGKLPLADGNVDALALSPDGKTVAVAFNGTIDKEKLLLLVPAGGTEVSRRCEGKSGFQGGFTHRIAFAPDGRHVAGVCEFPALVRSWDVATGRLVEWKSSVGSKGVAFSADGARILGLGMQEVFLWNPTGAGPVDERPIRSKLGRARLGGGEPRILVASPDGRRIAIAVDTELVLWDGATFAEIRRWDSGHRYSPLALAWSPDGKLLASADREIRIWRADDGQLATTLYGAWTNINDLTFAAEGRLIATCSSAGEINVFSVP